MSVLKEIPPYTGTNHTEQVLDSIRESRRRNLAAAQSEPYFARLDFQESGQQAPPPLYIGKVNLSTKERGGYRMYKSQADHCREYPVLDHSTHSKTHQKARGGRKYNIKL